MCSNSRTTHLSLSIQSSPWLRHRTDTHTHTHESLCGTDNGSALLPKHLPPPSFDLCQLNQEQEVDDEP